jgi:hypothetical protein
VKLWSAGDQRPDGGQAGVELKVVSGSVFNGAVVAIRKNSCGNVLNVVVKLKMDLISAGTVEHVVVSPPEMRMILKG